MKRRRPVILDAHGRPVEVEPIPDEPARQVTFYDPWGLQWRDGMATVPMWGAKQHDGRWVVDAT